MEQHSQEVMGIDLVGRVKKIQLAERNMLLPLFEAIVNSIHAIEDAKIPNGEISVTIHRELPFDESEENGFGIPDITQFDIEDNGIGFNAANYTSFKKADSTLKASRGAKGVGRFIWLKTFTDVHIESVFYENKKPLQRKFNFNIRVDSGINNSSLNGLTGTPKRGTKVELVGYKDPYKSKCPKRTSTIANRIIEHCLIYFKAPNCPIISIIDGSTSINLNNKFKELTFGNSYTGNFEIREYKFKVTLYKWFEHDELTHHKMSLCANNREVEDFDISKVFQDIQGKILDDESNKYYLITGYIESDYLDVNVNDERTKIKFASGGMFDDNLISRSELYESISPIIKEHFEQVVVEFHKKKIETLHAFINESAPQYKILLSKEGILDNVTITENNTEQDIDLKLYKIYQEIDYESRKNVAQIIQEIGNGDVEDNNLGDKYRKILHEISEVNKSKLAQYIVHRKYILELFDKSLGLNDDGKYEIEKTVHDIIFPTKKNSEEINFDEQNLWLIDERLSFHTFLSSDKPLNTIDGLDTDSTDRPDIAIFNNPLSFSEGDNSILNSIVLIEFKRPMRKQYDDIDENPITQLYGYVRKIRKGKQLLKNGRRYPVTNDTIFYAYLVCDINDKIIELAENAMLTRTSDGIGFFGYNESIKCVIEIMTFDQILLNANKRNKILFHKLGL